jgi:hypothetical protein
MVNARLPGAGDPIVQILIKDAIHLVPIKAKTADCGEPRFQ